MARPRLLPDNFTLCLIAAMVGASLLPVQGEVAVVFGWITNLAIALLFFMHVAKLSREAIWAGATHWCLHLVVFGCTFLLFPLSGLAIKPLLALLLASGPYSGMLS